MTNDDKQHLVLDFLRGASVADIATFNGVSRLAVENIIREGYGGILKLWDEARPKVEIAETVVLPPTH